MGRRYAISIGINNYPLANINDLNYASCDAISITRALSDPDRGHFECTTLTNENATKTKIISAINGLLSNDQLGADDLALIYFAGHGNLDASSNLFLYAYDTSTNSEREKIDLTTTIHIRELEILLDVSKIGTIILIIDACYSGAIGNAFKRIGYNQGNLVLLGACRSNQSSYEISSLGHGLFTSLFLEGLGEQPIKGEWITLQQILGFIDSKMHTIAPQSFEIVSHFTNADVGITKNPLDKIDSPIFKSKVEQLFRISKAQIEDFGLPSFFIAKQNIGLVESKIGVFCLDNQKVDVSNGVIDDCLLRIRRLRLENKIDRGLVVTEKSVALALTQQFGKTDLCKFRTIDELIKALMDFEPYLNHLIEQFEINPDSLRKPAIAKYYVELMTTQAGSRVTQPIAVALNNLLHSSSQKIAVLGEYGFGKTIFCKKLGCDMANEFLSTKKGRIPLIINLGKFPKIADLQALIISHLSQNCEIINPSWTAFERMNNAGLLLLIFDGLDEMVVRTSREMVERNLFEIEKLNTTPSSKIIITSRPEYFWNSLEEGELLGEGDFGQRRGYEILRIAPFTDNQIKEFLQKRIPLIKETNQPWDYYYNKIRKIYDLPDLSKRPVFLEMIAETLPK